MNMIDFNITRVMTKNVVTDSFQGIRNIFGLRLRGYERMIQQGIDDVMQEAKLRYDIKWYRLSINPLSKGSVMITIYGEGKIRKGFYDFIRDRPAIKIKRSFIDRFFRSKKNE